MKPDVILIDQRDNVAIALRDLGKGETIRLPDGRKLLTREEIPRSHKIALQDLAPGERIIKYGEIIGQARDYIERGSWVHTHNLAVED